MRALQPRFQRYLRVLALCGSSALTGLGCDTVPRSVAHDSQVETPHPVETPRPVERRIEAPPVQATPRLREPAATPRPTRTVGAAAQAEAPGGAAVEGERAVDGKLDDDKVFKSKRGLEAVMLDE